jgi:hypothetical protein
LGMRGVPGRGESGAGTERESEVISRYRCRNMSTIR